MWRAVRPSPGSETSTSFSASRPTLVIRFTSATSRSLPSGAFTIRVATGAFLERPLELQRAAGLAGRDLGLDARDEVPVGVPDAVAVEGPEQAGGHVLQRVDLADEVPVGVAVGRPRAAGLAGDAGARPVVRDLVVDDDRRDVHEHELPRRDRRALRALAVLELPRAERHPVEEVHALLDPDDLPGRARARLF